MPSLSEAYDGGRWDGRDPRRVSAGGGLFLVGTLAVVAAILVVTTGVADLVGATTDTAAKQLGGVLAGLGIPAILLGVVVVLPASRRERLGVVLGAAITVVGVAMFRAFYPGRWTRTADPLAFETAIVYFVGGAIALWFVFSAITSFKVRNNPQGTVELEITRQGETETIQVTPDQYRRYRRAARSDGGQDDEVVKEIESLYED